VSPDQLLNETFKYNDFHTGSIATSIARRVHRAGVITDQIAS